MPVRKVPRATQILYHQFLAMSAKTGLTAGKGAQNLPEALFLLVSQLCSTPESHGGHWDHCQALPSLAWKPRLVASLLPLFSPSLSPSWIGNVQWLHPLYHLICFLIWSWAAMWLIKGRCELSSSQRSPCIQTNMLIHCLFACIYLPLLLPTISKYIHSLPILPPPIYTFFLLSFYDRFILSLKIFLLQLIFYSRLK